jgi:hypothetical protein
MPAKSIDRPASEIINGAKTLPRRSTISAVRWIRAHRVRQPQAIRHNLPSGLE